jgi:hypothetical protein
MAEIIKDTVPYWMNVRRASRVKEGDGEADFLMNG